MFFAISCCFIPGTYLYAMRSFIDLAYVLVIKISFWVKNRAPRVRSLIDEMVPWCNGAMVHPHCSMCWVPFQTKPRSSSSINCVSSAAKRLNLFEDSIGARATRPNPRRVRSAHPLRVSAWLALREVPCCALISRSYAR